MREAVFTRVGARTLTFDPVSGIIYTMAPAGYYNPGKPVDANAFGVSYFPNVWCARARAPGGRRDGPRGGSASTGGVARSARGRYPNTLTVLAIAPPGPTA